MIHRKPIEQLLRFNYLGTGSSQGSWYLNKTRSFEHMCDTINCKLYSKTRNETRIKLNKIMAMSILMYDMKPITKRPKYKQ